jgi:hypothetical protein
MPAAPIAPEPSSGRSTARGSLRWLDRRLLVEKPLVWRTRVHLLPWALLALGGVAILAGCLYPVRREAVPIPVDVAFPVWFFRSISALPVLVWAAGQFRVPFGERSIGQYVHTSLLYALWIFLPIALPATLFLIPLHLRVAAVVPDREFADEISFH